jgi:23S rRNA-/tRNA-specific pseudouridylate synthase
MSDELEMVDAPEASESAEAAEGIEASDAGEQLQDQIAEAKASGASKKEIQKMIEKFELKVNGKNVVKEIDLSDKEAIKRELQLALAGRQNMQEMA